MSIGIGKRRVGVPQFLLDLREPPGALGIMVAAAFALFAAGLDPQVFGPSTPTVQVALRARPELESVLLLLVVVKAAFYLVGGALGDLFDRRRLVLVGLAGLLVAQAGSALSGSGPLLIASRILAVASVGLIVPVALASIATTYNGVARATAIGLAYGAFGGGTAIAQPLLNSLISGVGTAPSFIVAAIATGVALWLARRSLRPPHVGERLTRASLVAHGLWAYGLLAITTGLVGVGGDWQDPARLFLLGTGIAALGTFALWNRRRDRSRQDAPDLDLRPVAVVLFAGVVIAFAQVAPMQQAPLFFQIAADWKPFLASLATIPLTIGLLVAGPISGTLLSRASPRLLVAGGLAAVGFGDLILATANPSTSYLYFILPFIAIGVGFVIGTTIRTALIFASVPSRLPATAAAMNQTSVLIGGQIGLVVITALVSEVAINTFRQSVAGLDAASASAAIAQFEDLLKAIGTSSFGPLIGDLSSPQAGQIGAAYAAGVSAAFLAAGGTALVAAAVAWFGLSGREKLNSVWEHRDERGTAAAPAEAAG